MEINEFRFSESRFVFFQEVGGNKRIESQDESNDDADETRAAVGDLDGSVKNDLFNRREKEVPENAPKQLKTVHNVVKLMDKQGLEAIDKIEFQKNGQELYIHIDTGTSWNYDTTFYLEGDLLKAKVQGFNGSPSAPVGQPEEHVFEEPFEQAVRNLVTDVLRKGP